MVTVGTPLSPMPGLVWAYRFPADGDRAVDIAAADDISAMLAGDGVVWLHIALPDSRFEQKILQCPEISPDAAEVLIGRDRHLLLSARSQVLAGVMPDFRRELDDQLTDIDLFRFAMTERVLITTRFNPLQSAARVHAQIVRGRVFGSPVELFSALADAFEGSIEALVDDLTETIDRIEEDVFQGRRGRARSHLGSSRRDIARIHRTLRTLVRLFTRLDSGGGAGLSPEVRAALERRAHHTAALDQDVVLLQERARLLQEEVNTRQQEEMNRSLFVLSVATVLFLPPTLVTGFFGMNTKDMFLQTMDNGTAYAAAVLLAAAGAAWWLLRRHGLDRISD